MPTSARWEVVISPKISVKPIYSAGGQSRPPLRGTSASKSHRRGRRLCPLNGKLRIRRRFSKKAVHPVESMCTGKRQTHIRNAPSSRTAVTGIGPYNAYRRCIKNSELLQVPREKSRKTERVFLVALRDSVGKSKSTGSFSFGEVKENAEQQPLISESVIVLI